MLIVPLSRASNPVGGQSTRRLGRDASASTFVENPRSRSGFGPDPEETRRAYGDRMNATASTPPSTPADISQPREASVVLPLVGILLAIAIPVALAVVSGAGGGILIAVIGLLATVGILYGLTRFMMAIMGGDT